MGLTLRVATLKDAPLLCALGYASYLHHFGHLWQNRAELAEFLEQSFGLPALRQSLAAADNCWLIAENPQPVGFAHIKWQEPMPVGENRSARLDKLYLAPAATGRGYGSALFSAACDQARANGECYLWLEVLEKNPRAREFYRQRGMHHLSDTLFRTPSQNSTLQVLGMAL